MQYACHDNKTRTTLQVVKTNNYIDVIHYITNINQIYVYYRQLKFQSLIDLNTVPKYQYHREYCVHWQNNSWNLSNKILQIFG